MTGALSPIILAAVEANSYGRRLTSALESDGYTVWQAHSGAEARHILTHARRAGAQPDVAILQLELPDVDGRVLAAFLRKILTAPIVLSAPPEVELNRAVMYFAGVDALLGWPVDDSELHALLQSLLRRTPPRERVQSESPVDNESLQVGPLKIHERLRSASVAEQRLTLTPIQYRLLLTLARKPNVLVPVEELTRTVWNHEPDDGTAALIATQVTRLRRKLRARTNEPLSIVNVQQRGYRLLAA